MPRHDKNGNGRLDPEEVAAMQADQAKAATAPAAITESSGEIVALSPFEVVDNNRGYYAGTANTVPATANLSRNKAQAQFRLEQFGRLDGEMGYRESVDVNRVLLKNQLALRFSQVFQRQEFNLQPSGVKTERYNGMVKYRPFKNTTISGTYQHFHSYGRRPNSITPRDAVSQWLSVGAPTWDATTNTAYINGSPVNRNGQPTTQLGQGVPNINAGAAIFNSAFQTTGRGTSLMMIDTTGVSYWTAPRGTTTQDALLTTTRRTTRPETITC